MAWRVSRLTRAAALDPRDSARLVVLGRALLDLERYADAERVLGRAARALPDSKEAKLELGRALVRTGRNKEAVDLLAEVCSVDPRNVDAFRLRGEARVALGRYPAGLDDLEEALKLSKDKDARTRMLIARVCIEATDTRFRDTARAVDNARRAVELTKGRDAEALSVLAAAYAASNDYPRAVIEMRKAVQLRPGSKTYRQLLRIYEGRAR